MARDGAVATADERGGLFRPWGTRLSVEEEMFSGLSVTLPYFHSRQTWDGGLEMSSAGWPCWCLMPAKRMSRISLPPELSPSMFDIQHSDESEPLKSFKSSSSPGSPGRPGSAPNPTEFRDLPEYQSVPGMLSIPQRPRLRNFPKLDSFLFPLKSRESDQSLRGEGAIGVTSAIPHTLEGAKKKGDAGGSEVEGRRGREWPVCCGLTAWFGPHPFSVGYP